jgi:hypothetical protein
VASDAVGKYSSTVGSDTPHWSSGDRGSECGIVDSNACTYCGTACGSVPEHATVTEGHMATRPVPRYCHVTTPDHSEGVRV